MPTEPRPDPAPGATVEELIRHRLATALGGWRGSVETALPTVAFVVLWVWRKDLTAAIVASIAVTVVLAVLRTVQQQSLQYVLSAVFPTAIAFTTWAYALSHTTAGRMGATTYLVPPVTIVLAWVLLGETPVALAFVGGALCLAGVALSRRTGPRWSR